MSTNRDFKALWNRQQTALPDLEELFQKTRNYKKSQVRRLLLSNGMLLLTSVFIGFIWYYFNPRLLTTKIGIVLTIAAMALYLIVYNRMFPTLAKVGYEKNIRQHLQQLLKLQQKQRFLQGTMLTVYFILLSAGLCLYLFEYTARMTVLWAIFSYALPLLWILFNWFYLRPRSIKQQQAKLNGLISRYETLWHQLTGNE